MSERPDREYLSDDCDVEENRLRLSQGGNGDWYVTILKPGERMGVAVRISTSGTRRGQHEVPLAVLALYRAMGGEPITPEHERPATLSCTGISARWCPNCGNCKCSAERRGLAGDMDEPDCPLHALNSMHGADPEFG